MMRRISSLPGMYSVDSSAIEAIGYKSGNRELYVRFLESRDYIYYDVEKQIFHDFLRADSKGRYFNEEIRECYDFRKL